MQYPISLRIIDTTGARKDRHIGFESADDARATARVICKESTTTRAECSQDGHAAMLFEVRGAHAN